MIELIYVVYKETIKRQEQHPYEPVMRNLYYTDTIMLEPTLSNPAEVIQNWINAETKLYNNKRTEAEKKEFRYSIVQASELKKESEE
jgi:hypothetical protein